MSPRSNWLDGRVDVLLAELNELGMSISRPAGAELIRERVQWVASEVGISPVAARRYLTNDALVRLARTMVISFADETPGADVIDAPRTSPLPLPIFARCVAGLGESIQVRLRERDEVDHLRTTVEQVAHALSALGQVAERDFGATRSQPGRPADVVMMPPGLLNRAARYLEATAGLVRDGVLPDGFDAAHAEHLAATFLQDAASLRYYAAE